MGFFKKIGRGFKRGFTKIGKGIKTGARKVGKVAAQVRDFGSKVGFVSQMPTPQEMKEFNIKNKGKTGIGKLFAAAGDSATRTFKNLQAPAKLVKAIDPLRNTKVGKAGFSPISLAADIVSAIPSSVGVIGQSITDKERRKKLKSGDLDSIIDLALAPVAFIGTGAVSGAGKAISKGLVRAGLKTGAKEAAKSTAKTTAKTGARLTTKQVAPKIAGRFNEATLKFKPIKEIAKTTKVPKQTLSKAQRLAMAKKAIKKGDRILNQF